MLNKPTVAELLEKGDNRYTLVIATAKRARQIYAGSLPISKCTDTAPVTQAAEEIDNESLKIYTKEEFESEDIVNPLASLEAKKAKEALEKAKLEEQEKLSALKSKKSKSKLVKLLQQEKLDYVDDDKKE